jgi:hypothetical protein
MTADELERLLQAAPPGTQFEIVRITTPGHPSSLPVQEANSEALGGDGEWTPLQVVEWAREHHPGGLKLSEWTEMPIGVSMRKLVAAAACGELKSFPKPTGRDHGARMVTPDAMATFLAKRSRLGDKRLEGGAAL